VLKYTRLTVEKKEKMMKKVKIIVAIIAMIIMCCAFNINVNAENIEAEEVEPKEIINSVVESFGEQGLTKSNLAQAIEKYRELSKEYTNDEIAKMLEESKEELEEKNISADNVDTINKVLKNFDEKQVNKVLDKLNIDEALDDLEAGATVSELMEKATADMTTADKADLVLSVLWSANIIHSIVIIIVILEVYKLIVRFIIYKKAGKKPWAIFIPIYRDVTMLKICGMTPLWLILLCIPVVGWALLWIVKVASRFMLAEAFDKTSAFGFGLWLLWPIFESILAFSDNSIYVGVEE
jgi:hypothetical protein